MYRPMSMTFVLMGVGFRALVALGAVGIERICSLGVEGAVGA